MASFNSSQQIIANFALFTAVKNFKRLLRIFDATFKFKINLFYAFYLRLGRYHLSIDGRTFYDIISLSKWSLSLKLG